MEYEYKDFKIEYTIQADPQNPKIFHALGHATCQPVNGKTSEPVQFSTSFNTHFGAEAEIKKIIEEYIDFEWVEFNKMQDSE